MPNILLVPTRESCHKSVRLQHVKRRSLILNQRERSKTCARGDLRGIFEDVKLNVKSRDERSGFGGVPLSKLVASS